MELTWDSWEAESTSTRYGWCDGFHVAQVIWTRKRGWRAFIAHEPVDDVGYETPGEAKAACERAVADEPPPRRAPPAPARRRVVRNRGPDWAPHPGKLRRPPP